MGKQSQPGSCHTVSQATCDLRTWQQHSAGDLLLGVLGCQEGHSHAQGAGCAIDVALVRVSPQQVPL